MKDPKLLELMKNYRGRDEVPADFDTFWITIILQSLRQSGIPMGDWF